MADEPAAVPAAEPAPTPAVEAAPAPAPLAWPSAADLPADPTTEETAPSGVPDPVPDPNAPPVDPDTPVSEAPVPEVFDRKYVEKLRNEAAESRVAAKPYTEAFSDYEPAQVEAFLDLARGLADPARHVATARKLNEMAQAIANSYEVDLNNADPNQPMTRAEYEAEQQKQAQHQATQTQIAKITAEIDGLGYTPGTTDHALLLHFASQDPTGDLTKADAAVKAHNQEIIDKFVADQRANKDRHLQSPAPAGSAPAEVMDQPKTFKGARAAMNALLAADQ